MDVFWNVFVVNWKFTIIWGNLSIFANLIFYECSQILYPLETFAVLYFFLDFHCRWSMLEVLKDQKMNNYLLWAQKGKSSAFSSLLAGKVVKLM